MPAKLYVVHGSHPCAAVQRALEMKSVPHKVVELLPPMHAALQRVRFGTRTVPGLTLESGEKISASRAIIRRLEELAPEPSLLPADPEERVSMQRAEEWGDEVRRPMARRLLWRTFTLHPQAMKSYQAGSRFPLPGPAVRALAPAVNAVERKLNGAEEGAVRADLRSLPDHLDRINVWLRDGVLGGETVNAADLQIATTSRLMLTIGDVRPYFAGRPAEAHAMGLSGSGPGPPRRACSRRSGSPRSERVERRSYPLWRGQDRRSARAAEATTKGRAGACSLPSMMLFRRPATPRSRARTRG